MMVDSFDWLILSSSSMILFGMIVGLWLWRQSVLLDRRFGRDP